MKTIRKTVFLDLAAAKEKGEVRSMKSEQLQSETALLIMHAAAACHCMLENRDARLLLRYWVPLT